MLDLGEAAIRSLRGGGDNRQEQVARAELLLAR